MGIWAMLSGIATWLLQVQRLQTNSGWRPLLEPFLDPFQKYTVPLDTWIDAAVTNVAAGARPFFQNASLPVRWVLETIESFLLAVPPLLLVVAISALVWRLAGRKMGVFSFVALAAIGFAGAWDAAMVSLSLVVAAVLFCTALGIPTGIFCARSDRFRSGLLPFLDAMQTLPSFVYLVPVVMLFGIGKVPGAIVTIVFALPPLIRLTDLGIRQVSSESVEAALAFGSTPNQVLWEVQLPLALPTILAGLNQAILLALSMSVVTSMIAVEGLGQMVLLGVGRLNVGLATVGGLGIVLLAILLDRVTRAVVDLSQGNASARFSKRDWMAGVAIALVLALSTFWQPVAGGGAIADGVFLPGAGVRVRHAGSSAGYGPFISAVVSYGLEQLGYEVGEPKTLSVPATYLALSNGDLDFYVPSWEQIHRKFFEKPAGTKALEHVGVFVDKCLQGYQIDKKTADRYQIQSLERLKDPEIAKLFDSDGDGKANLIGCKSGWSCEQVIEHHLDAYGLRDTVEHDRGEYAPLMADALARYRQGGSILYYAWTPNWVDVALKPDRDAVWLSVPFASFPEGWGEVKNEEATVDGKNLGFAVDRMRVIATTDFLDANPAAKYFFEHLQIPIAEVSAQQKLVSEGEDTPEDGRRHAREWIEANRDRYDRWLEDARAAGKN